MDNQYTLGYKAGLDAAVKVCRENAEVWERLNAEDEKHSAERCAAEIAALPVSEVQFDVNELLDILQEAVNGMGGSYATWSPKARAVIAKFKEKQL